MLQSFVGDRLCVSTHARDPARVQAAVDRGRTVALRRTFDFGENGNINIRPDVEILGQLSTGQQSTKVKKASGPSTADSRTRFRRRHRTSDTR